MYNIDTFSMKIALLGCDEVEVGDKVFLAEAPLREFDEKAFVCVAIPVVVCLLIGVCAVFLQHQVSMAVATNCVVPSQRIGGDRGNEAAHVGVKAVGRAQVENVLALEGVRHVVAFGPFEGVVEEHADVGTAVEVGEFEAFTARDHAGPHAGPVKRFFVDRVHGRLLAPFA